MVQLLLLSSTFTPLIRLTALPPPPPRDKDTNTNNQTVIDKNSPYYKIKITPNESYIVINKEKEHNYKYNVSLLLNRCRDYKTIVGQQSQLCLAKLGRRIARFITIPSATRVDYPIIDSTLQSPFDMAQRLKPFAPHFVVLNDVALYRKGDILGIDGTAHYTGVCREYGPTGYDNIKVLRKDVVWFFDYPVLNLVTLWSGNYFHALVSYLPRFLSLLPILKAIPNAVVITNMHPFAVMTFIEPILNYYDIYSKDINFNNIEYDKVYFAKQVIAPLSECKRIPQRYVKMIRDAALNIYDTSVEERR